MPDTDLIKSFLRLKPLNCSPQALHNLAPAQPSNPYSTTLPHTPISCSHTVGQFSGAIKLFPLPTGFGTSARFAPGHLWWRNHGSWPFLLLLVGKRERAGPGVTMTGLGGWSLEGMGKLVLFYTVKKQRPGSVWQTSPLGTGPPRDTDHRPLQLKGPLRMAGPVLQGTEKSGLDPSFTVCHYGSRRQSFGVCHSLAG